MPKKVDMLERRRAFISASVDVIATEGLPAATLRRIALEASCTTGALTHYFDNRKVLLLETLKTVHNNAGRRMIKATQTNDTDSEILMQVLLESLPLDEMRLKEWRVWLAFWNAAMDDESLTRENIRRYDEWFGLVHSLLAPLVEHESLNLKTKELIALIDGLGIGVVRQRIAGKALKMAQNECSALLKSYVEAYYFNV